MGNSYASFFVPPGLPGPSFGGSDDSPPLPDNNPGLIATASASRDAAIAQSNNQVTISQTQAATLQLGILKNSQDAQFQTLAWLTERLDATDAKVQIAVENAKISMVRESDRHAEAEGQIKLDGRELEIRALENNRAKETS
jgi:hypothetical protein